MAPKHIWYVSFKALTAPDPKRPTSFPRVSRTFETEAAAKQFANEISAATNDVIAGTINPHFPKRIVAPAEIPDWIARRD